MLSKKIVVSAIALSGIFYARAQESVNTSGGDASGSGGSSSYSIGQMAYVSTESSAGSVSQGVQHAYSITVVTNHQIVESSINLSVFPNPTSDELHLQIDRFDGLSFQLRDLEGNILKDISSISSNITKININELPVATYLLTVADGESALRTFQIIKQD